LPVADAKARPLNETVVPLPADAGLMVPEIL
jgi:hypothetical protein